MRQSQMCPVWLWQAAVPGDGSVFEGVFHLCCRLLGVARDTIGASLGLEAVTSGRSANCRLGCTFRGFGLVRDLLPDTHVGVLSSVILLRKTRRGEVDGGMITARLAQEDHRGK